VSKILDNIRTATLASCWNDWRASLCQLFPTMF